MTSTLHGPPQGSLHVLRERWPELPWHSLRETHGAFHHVLLLPPVAAVRIRTGPGHEGAVRREQTIAGLLAGAELPVPRPWGEPVHTAAWSAATLTCAPGAAREPRSWAQDRTALLALRETWTAAGHEHPELASALPGARSWCGGEHWPELARQLLGPGPQLQQAARERIETVLELEGMAEQAVVHGDFGNHNILWDREGRPTLIDTDHAAWADPAIDIAPLLAAYPRRDLVADLPGPLLDRAAAHRRTLSLQVAVAAHLRDDRQLRDHALANFARRIHSGDPRW